MAGPARPFSFSGGGRSAAKRSLWTGTVIVSARCTTWCTYMGSTYDTVWQQMTVYDSRWQCNCIWQCVTYGKEPVCDRQWQCCTLQTDIYIHAMSWIKSILVLVTRQRKRAVIHIIMYMSMTWMLSLDPKFSVPIWITITEKSVMNYS